MAKKDISKIKELLLGSTKTAILTGAGISTESGIMDFRSPGGIWSKFDPGVFTCEMLSNSPEKFYKKGLGLLEYLDEIGKAEPNKAHYILSDFEDRGLIDTIITQNIDGLHQKAGSRKVLEIHGNLSGCYCLTCGDVYDLHLLVGQVRAGNIPPRCKRCGGILRPSIVLFGDMLPDCFHEAEKSVKESDLLIVIGSSLEISPANMLLEDASQIVIINRKGTYFDNIASVVLHKNASDALDSIKRAITHDTV